MEESTKTKVWSLGSLVLIILMPTAFALTGCGSAQDGNPNVGAGHADGVSLAPGTPDNPPPIDPPGPPPNANTITLGVRYVAERLAATDAPSPTLDQVKTLITNMSNIWSQCDIRFALEVYDTPVAGDDGLAYYPANQWQLEAARSKYDDRRHMLLVKTGTWNRGGDLGADGSNGFSTLPPANPEGAVFEQSVAVSTLLISHETGHLIGGLDHTSDTTNLMNHFVTSQTTQLSQTQCDNARRTINQYHTAWMR